MTTWRERAACKWDELDWMLAEPTEAHVQTCRGCDVAGDCLAYALGLPQAKDFAGLYAATTPEERRQMRKEVDAA